MLLGSLFDGIGGWLLAAKHAGVMPMWASEIDDFPATVTAKHFPEVQQLGDITKIDVDKLEPVDIICAGSPCQDLSVAGKRAGLEGERSGLFRTAVNIVHELRSRTGKPRYFVWENVPGTFSSNKGLDFRAVLEEITKTEISIPTNNKWAGSGVVEWDGGSLAWRVLDAQYWGVPQRRKRVFLVADFGGKRAGEILFEPESLSGNTQKGCCKRQGTAEGTERRAGEAGRTKELKSDSSMFTPKCALIRENQSATLSCSNTQTLFQPLVFENHGQDTRFKGPISVAQTIVSAYGTGGNNQPFVVEVSDSLTASDYKRAPVVNQRHVVRKLTPLECERLQGIPDGYTDVEFNGKPAPDSRRYKALGNGMAQPCADYVIRRIVSVTEDLNDGGKNILDNMPSDVL